MRNRLNIERQKKSTNKVYIIIGIISFIITVFLLLHVFALLDQNPRYTLSDAINNVFMDVVTNPLNMSLSSNSISTIFLGGLFLGCIIVMLITARNLRKHDNTDIIHGEARLMNVKDLEEHNIKRVEPVGKKDVVLEDNIIISKDIFVSPHEENSNTNCNQTVIGAAGTGKSFYFVAPNVLQANCNYLITDPSGELLDKYGKYLENQGYAIKTLNFLDTYKGNHYNPLHYIQKEEDVLKLVDVLIKNTSDPDRKGGDQFWENGEKLFLNAVILLIWSNYDPEWWTMESVMKMLEWAEVNEDDPNQPSKLDILFEKLKETDPDNLAIVQYNGFKKGAGKTLKSFLISLATRLQAFNFAHVKYLTKTDDLELDKFPYQKQAIFVMVPSTNTTLNFLAAMMYTQLFDVLYSIGSQQLLYSYQLSWDKYHVLDVPKPVAYPNEENISKEGAEKLLRAINEGTNIIYNEENETYEVKLKDNSKIIGWRGTKQAAEEFQKSLKNLQVTKCRPYKMPQHVHFIFDEFANCGTIPEFDKIATTCRKFDISFAVIIQSINQLKKMYKDEWGTIIGNCSEILFLGCNETDTTEWLVKLCGKKTVHGESMSLPSGRSGNASNSYQASGEDLIHIDDLTRLKTDECFVINAGENPHFGKKFKALNHPKWEEAKALVGKYKIKSSAAPVGKNKKESVESIASTTAKSKTFEADVSKEKSQPDSVSSTSSSLFSQSNITPSIFNRVIQCIKENELDVTVASNDIADTEKISVEIDNTTDKKVFTSFF